MTARCTLLEPTERLGGVGLHTGEASWLQILPAETSGVGILFRNARTSGEVIASWQSVVSTNRSTCIASQSTRVDTVEHVLSALYGCGVSDAVVLFDGPELPIGDGSSEPFVELIESVGTGEIDGQIEELTLDEPIVRCDSRGAVITAVPSDRFWIAATVDYSKYSAIGIQTAIYKGESYDLSIAPARTYGFYSELDALKSAGLGRGVSLNNVVALDGDGKPDPQTPLRMSDELVRHKILDLVGDLSLTQKKLKVGIVAIRPSHTLNARLCGALLGFDGG